MTPRVILIHVGPPAQDECWLCGCDTSHLREVLFAADEHGIHEVCTAQCLNDNGKD